MDYLVLLDVGQRLGQEGHVDIVCEELTVVKHQVNSNSSPSQKGTHNMVLEGRLQIISERVKVIDSDCINQIQSPNKTLYLTRNKKNEWEKEKGRKRRGDRRYLIKGVVELLGIPMKNVLVFAKKRDDRVDLISNNMREGKGRIMKW